MIELSKPDARPGPVERDGKLIVEVRELTARQVREAVRFGEVDQALLVATGEHLPAGVVEAATGLDSETLGDLAWSDLQALVRAVLEVNADFFRAAEEADKKLRAKAEARKAPSARSTARPAFWRGPGGATH